MAQRVLLGAGKRAVSRGVFVVMNDLFAIEPESLVSDDAEYCSAIASKFGFSTGLFLVDAPEKWTESVRMLAACDSPIKRMRLVEFLTMVRARRLLLEAEKITQDIDWSESSAISDRGSTVNLIANKPEHPRSVLYDLVVGRDQDKLGPRPSSVALGTAENFLKILTPLILSGGEIHLIDRYAAKNILSRDLGQISFFKKFFTGMWEIANAAVPSVSSFCVHIFDNPETPATSYLEGRLNALCSSGVYSSSYIPQIRVIESKIAFEEVHKRYFLGKNGGIELDAGLRADDTKRRIFSYIDKEVHQDQWHAHVSSQRF